MEMGWVTKARNYVLKYIFIKILATFQGTPSLISIWITSILSYVSFFNVQIIEETEMPRYFPIFRMVDDSWKYFCLHITGVKNGPVSLNVVMPSNFFGLLSERDIWASQA